MYLAYIFKKFLKKRVTKTVFQEHYNSYTQVILHSVIHSLGKKGALKEGPFFYAYIQS